MKLIQSVFIGSAMFLSSLGIMAQDTTTNMANETQSIESTQIIPAPDFKLKDLNGKEVSLSDYRGKWVILDFWGSWCIWCIRGIPELKEAYEKYNGQLEIIGIDCNETEEAWRAGVEKYGLNWVNVYCPKSDYEILKAYDVQGFPTKAIVDPEGNLVNITVGHDPNFYTVLSKLLDR